MRNSDIQRRPIFLLKILGVVVLYALTARLAITYAISGFVTLIWPASGLALAALLSGGKRYAWGVFFGALLAYTMVGKPFWASIIIATGNTLEALFGAWLITRRNGRFDSCIRSLRDYLRLIFLSGGVGSSIAALVGVTTLLVFGFISSETYFRELLQWWMGDTLGVILITPLILSWQKTKSSHEASTVEVIEPIVLLGLTFFVGQVIFLDLFHYGVSYIAKGYWMFLLVTWVAVRLGIRWVAIALFVTAAQALWGAYHGIGYFADDIAQTQLANYWLYTVTLSIVGMALATYFTERKLTEEALRTNEASLRAILNNSPYLVWLKDAEGRYIHINKTYVDYARLKDDQQAIGKTDRDLWPRELAEKYCIDDAEVMALRKQKHVVEKSFYGNRIHWVETFKTPVVDEEGNVLGITGFSRDITEQKQAEAELRISMDRLKEAQHIAHLGSWELDLMSGELIWSDETFRLFEVQPSQFAATYQAFLNAIHPDDRDVVNRTYMESLARRTPYEITYRLLMDDGRIKWVHEQCISDFDAMGKPLRSIGTIHDITERKQTEDALMKLSLAVEQSPSSIVITDLDASIEYVNQAFVNETGYSLGDVMGQNPRILNSGKNSKAIYEEMWACLTCGKAWKGELINRRKDGSEYIESVLISPVCQPDGQVTHYLATKENITKRKNNEAKIRRLSRTYRLLSQVNEAIVRTNDKNELFAAICSAAIESELFRFAWIGMLDENWVIPVMHAGVEDGYLSSNFNILLDDERTGNGTTGRAIREGIHVICQDIEHDPSMTPWCEDAMRCGYRSSAAFPICEKGGEAGAINVYAPEAHFFTPDIIGLMLELAADVSFALDVFIEKQCRERAEDEIMRIKTELEHRVLERTHQLEVANKELEAFSYSVSHDLRAPLRSIDGFSRVLSNKYRDRLDATGQDWLERICRASQHMGHLIDDMLKLSQVTRGTLKREQVDLSKIAENLVDGLSKTNPERQIRVTLQQGLSVQADPGLLRIVMDNLLGNAFKFTGKKPDAEIEFGMRDIDGERVFFVRDNGDGFNMEYAHKLFGAFQRLHTTNEFEGTGIGLATVQRVIYRHNGKLWAEAIEGQGATFYFTLPQETRET